MEMLIHAVCDALLNQGWRVTREGMTLEACREDIKSQWWFGSRRVQSSLRCVCDATTKTLAYREVAKEVVTGMAPPTFTRSTWKQSGITVDIERTDHAPGGGGTLIYGQARRSLEDICRQHGWQLKEMLSV